MHTICEKPIWFRLGFNKSHCENRETSMQNIGLLHFDYHLNKERKPSVANQRQNTTFVF